MKAQDIFMVPMPFCDAVAVLGHYARGVAHYGEAAGRRLLDSLESIQWLLWHGNQHHSRE